MKRLNSSIFLFLRFALGWFFFIRRRDKTCRSQLVGRSIPQGLVWYLFTIFSPSVIRYRHIVDSGFSK
jgi:hypothetical protein